MSDVQSYTVGWICAITTEAVAAASLLDETHELPEFSEGDNNSYRLGRIARHNVVIAILPKQEYGTNSAATVARDLVRTFPNIRIGLMVGVGGGVPSDKHDIRLGDVVVSSSHNGVGGVFQYDFGKAIQGGAFQHTGFLNQPPTLLRTAVANLEADHELAGHQLENLITEALEKNHRLKKKYSRPAANKDTLYKPDFTHLDPLKDCFRLCDEDPTKIVSRSARDEGDALEIHYGLIASGNQVVKDAQLRDKLAAEQNVLCFEMEAAGLMNHFPCLVIRGICDYADSHKNKDWQGFAALAAAAYAKDLLSRIPPKKVELETKISDVLASVTKELQQVHSASQEITATILEMRTDHQAQQMMNWLKPADPYTNVNKAKQTRHAGTGSWLVTGEIFSQWKLGQRQNLWLYGSPGCGKTFLSTTILDELKKSKNCIVTIFFFDFTDKRKQGLGDMLRSLICQLYSWQPELYKFMDKRLEEHDKGQKQPDIDLLSTFLRKMTREAPKRVLLLLDALDECSERRELLHWLETVMPTMDNVKLIASGRSEDKFEDTFHRCIGSSNCVPLSKESIDADIGSYVGARVDLEREFQRWSTRPDVLHRIKSAVISKADGMFRWAACQLDSLGECVDLESLEAAIQSLPPDLDTTYARIIDNIPTNRKEKTMRLLQFLVCSERPLSLEEAVDIVAIRLRAGYFDAKDRLPRPAEIKAYCSSLVSVSKPPTDGILIELRLAHFSVKEYLVGRVKEFQYPDPMATVTRTCLTYLQGIRQDTVPSLPLAKYAADSWMRHAKCVEGLPEVQDAITRFLSDELRARLWVRLLKTGGWWNGAAPSHPLFYVCSEGLTATAKFITSNSTSISPGFGGYGGAMAVAVLHDHLDILQLLVDKAMLVDNPGDYDYEDFHPLTLAAREGHLHIVQWLIGRGIDVNVSNGRAGSPIQASAEEGHLEIVRFLLNSGSDVNAHSKKGAYRVPALHLAAAEGYLEIVRLLLENGAAPELIKCSHKGPQRGPCGRQSALDCASRGGHLEIVQLLLSHGARIAGGARDSLHAAARQGHMEIVQLLIKYGADVNQEHCGVTPLEYALQFGNHRIVMLLLEHGATFEKANMDTTLVLRRAAAAGDEEFVRFVLEGEMGAEIHSGYDFCDYSAALAEATVHGHLEIFKFLIEYGNGSYTVEYMRFSAGNAVRAVEAAEAVAAGDGGSRQEILRLLATHTDGSSELQKWQKFRASARVCAALREEAVILETPLITASARGRSEEVQMLLDDGADINATDPCWGTALQIASYNGCWDTVRLLVDRGASINVKRQRDVVLWDHASYTTALEAAAQRGHLAIAKLLIDRGADVHAALDLDKKALFHSRDDSCTTALEAAARGGHMPVVELLLDSGASINPERKDCGSALQEASANGFSDVVCMLLERGADVNAEGGFYGSAIETAAKHGNLETVRLLLEHGADHKQALQIASENGHCKIVQLLLEYGGEPRPAPLPCFHPVGSWIWRISYKRARTVTLRPRSSSRHLNTADVIEENTWQRDGHDTWGFVIYRTTYVSDDGWARARGHLRAAAEECFQCYDAATKG